MSERSYLDNQARTWIKASGEPNVEALTIEVSDGSALLFAGTTDGDVFSSEDEGEHWSKIASNLPPISKWCHHRNLNN